MEGGRWARAVCNEGSNQHAMREAISMEGGRWARAVCNEGGNQHAMREAISMEGGRWARAVCNEGGNQHAMREAISMEGGRWARAVCNEGGNQHGRRPLGSSSTCTRPWTHRAGACSSHGCQSGWRRLCCLRSSTDAPRASSHTAQRTCAHPWSSAAIGVAIKCNHGAIREVISSHK